MDLLIRFVHIIAAMVYLGLPFAFGRWYRSTTLVQDQAPMSDALGKISTFISVHLNICAVIMFATGFHLAMTFGYWPKAIWIHISMTTLLLAVINCNLLLPTIKKYRMAMEGGPLSEDSQAALRKRIAMFSGIHHTLVTITVALMVWKPS